MITARAALGVSSALVAIACGGDGAGAAPPNELSYALHSWTTALPADALAALTNKDDSDGTLRFRGAPSAVRARQPGEVIVAGNSPTTPHGLLRVVVSVADDGGDTVVTTLPVPLPFAFKNLHARLRRAQVDVAVPSSTLGARAWAPRSFSPAYTASKVVGGSRVFDAVLFNQDGNLATRDDQFVVHAELSGKVGYTASVDLDWLDDGNVLSQAKSCLEKLVKNPLSIFSSDDCVPIPDVKVTFDASLAGDAILDVEGASAQSYASDDIYLNDEPWELEPLYAGPVVLVPELDYTAKVEGDAASLFHARTEFGYEVSVGAAAGVRSGVTPPNPKFTKKYAKPIVSVSSTGHSKASFGPRLSLLAYDAFGFYADLHGYGTLDADQGKTPCWDYTIGVELEPGVRLRIPWKKFGLGMLAKKLGWDHDLVAAKFGTIDLYQEHPFASALVEQRACDKPPASALPLGEGPSSDTYQNPTFAPWSFRFGGLAAVTPFVATPGQHRTPIEKGHDSSWLVSGSYVGSVTSLSNAGDVRWARRLAIGLLPDEKSLALDANASSVLAAPSVDATIFAAADRLTLASIGYDGALRWAKRLRTPTTGLPDAEVRAMAPVAMTRMPGGDFVIFWSQRTVAGSAHELVLTRVAMDGTLRFAKRFHYPTGDTSVGATLVPVGADVVVGGYAFAPGETGSYLMRVDPSGVAKWQKRMGACGSTRVRIEAATLRASGDLALFATYDVAPERNAFATVSADGVVRGAVGNWSGSNVQDLTAVAFAELPTSGFVSVEEWTPYVGNGLVLSTRDSLGNRTASVGYGHQKQDLSALTTLRPSGLRLTTDGGAIVVTHVTQDKGLNDDGLWISKVPARTLDAPYDPTLVKPVSPAYTAVPCDVTMTDATIALADYELYDEDVTSIVAAQPIDPQRDPRLK